MLIVLIDDMGFGQSSAFGGPIHMPTVERLAKSGLRYNQFHTTALCSPTRAALLTGRNHHMSNMGSITETATAFPGQTGQRPNSVAPLAEMLRLNGYSTAAFGKSHETAAWEVSPSGPTDRWPTRSGFDKFYGFIGGETNQWAPLHLRRHDPGRAAEGPELPLHDRHDQPGDQVDAVPEVADAGQAVLHLLRARRHARAAPRAEGMDRQVQGQVRPGLGQAARGDAGPPESSWAWCPPDTKLAPKPEAIKDWDTLTADEKKLFARQMEVFAGFGEYADTEIGRLIQAIEDLGQLDNTLIFYIVGDNGASAEGGMNGLFNEMTYFNGVPETVAGHPQALRRAGRPDDLSATTPPAGPSPATRRSPGPSRSPRSYGGTPQRDGRPLAQGDQGEGRGALAVAPRHRHRADDPGGGRPARAEDA